MQIKIKKHAEKIRFLIVGCLNTAIDITILFILVKFFGLPKIYSNTISTSVALIFSFFVNKNFTFQDISDAKKSIQFVKFLTITLFGLWSIQPIIITSMSYLLVNFLTNQDLVLFISKIIATGFTMIWNYVLYRKFIFKSV